jgi:uncharacterized membrane protein YjfL (UPF0719 family)
VTATDVLSDLAASASYAVLGAALLLVGFVLVDLLTPGRLRTQIWVDRNANAATFLASAMIGIGAIVFTAILTSGGDFSDGLILTGAFGLGGIALMCVAFFLLDLLTPGKLGEIMVDPERHPAVWVSAALNIAVAAVVCASIT